MSLSHCSVSPLSQGPVSLHVFAPEAFFRDVHFKTSSRCLVVNSVIELSTTILREADYRPGLRVRVFLFCIV